jgi:hypothetical protein
MNHRPSETMSLFDRRWSLANFRIGDGIPND